MGATVDVFVFPLTRVTLFPRTTKPLNIFEPRYIKLINDAIEQDRNVAIAFSEPGTPREAQVGVKGRIRSVVGVGKVKLIEKRPDQSMIILIEGSGKVHLDNVIEGEEPYLKARASWIEEHTELSSANLFVMNRLMKQFHHWLNTHVTDQEARENFTARLKTAEERVNAMCSLMVLDSDTQQSLLEANSIDERLVQLAMAAETDAYPQ